jgi:hypothetical protein
MTTRGAPAGFCLTVVSVSRRTKEAGIQKRALKGVGMSRSESVATRATTISWCTTCRADMAFEQPDCLDGHGVDDDGHGVDCPEWSCVVCGEAVFVAFGLTEPAARAGRGGRASHVA